MQVATNGVSLPSSAREKFIRAQATQVTIGADIYSDGNERWLIVPATDTTRKWATRKDTLFKGRIPVNGTYILRIPKRVRVSDKISRDPQVPTSVKADFRRNNGKLLFIEIVHIERR